MTTKKDIYFSYGISYDGKKISTPIGPMNELLKKGNSKTGAAVKTWSMNQTTCERVCPGCYANYGCYQFKSVKESLAKNTELATNHLEYLEAALRAQCETFKAGTEIRIHAVGDFFSDEYAAMWYRIARDFPQLVFWTYTKRSQYEDLFAGLENANVVKSLVNGQYNFGHCDHVKRLYNELSAAGKNVHICRCGVDDNQHCAGCHKCSISEYVLFIEHSTGYDAKEDPLFAELETIVNNQ